MQILAILCLAVLAISHVHAGWFSNFILPKEYDDVNDHLVKANSTGNVEWDMAEIKRWGAKKAAGRGNSLIVKALKQISALENLADPKNCHLQGYRVISANVVGARGEEHLIEPIRRVDKLVQHYMMEYNNVCYPLYSEMIKAKRQSLDPSVTRAVDAMVPEYIRQSAAGVRLQSFRQGEICSEVKDEELEGFNPYQTLKILAADDPDKKYLKSVPGAKDGTKVLDKKKVEELVDRYIFQPCIQFNNALGEEFYEIFHRRIIVSEDGVPKIRCRKVMTERIAVGICHAMVHISAMRKFTMRSLTKQIKGKN